MSFSVSRVLVYVLIAIVALIVLVVALTYTLSPA